MEDLIRDVADNLKRVVAFLDKVKDKKLKPERDEIANSLKNCLRRCSEKLKIENEEAYNDVEVNRSSQDIYNDVEGENYDDVGTTGPTRTLPGPLAPHGPSVDDEDNVYEDNQGQAYDDVALKGIPLTECEKLTHPVLADFMELKKAKATILTSTWQKRWCVIHNGILYIYDGAKDKQQKEAFDLKTYKFQIRDDITKESKRKDRCFELKSDSLNKTYEFCAVDKESLLKWRAALQIRQQGRKSVDVDETYDDVGANESSKPKKKGISIPIFGKKKGKSATPSVGTTAEEENAYDDTDNQTYQDTANDAYDDTAQQAYDDTGTDIPTEDDNETYEGYDEDPKRPLPPPMLSAPLDSKQRRTSTRDELPPLPSPNSRAPTLPDRHSPSVKSRNNDALPPPPLPGREEVGSGSGTFHRNRPPMPIPSESKNNRALPPPPASVLDELGRQPSSTPQVDQYASDDEFSVDSMDDIDAGKANDDYENMYQGMWDCDPDEDNELRFKRGEIVHIISREYDNYGWWVAEGKDEEVGLVPVSYLMKAYDI